MLLKDKIAVIHGAAGHIGSAIARTFAREGATLFLCGRRSPPLSTVPVQAAPAARSAMIGIRDMRPRRPGTEPPSLA